VFGGNRLIGLRNERRRQEEQERQEREKPSPSNEPARGRAPWGHSFFERCTEISDMTSPVGRWPDYIWFAAPRVQAFPVICYVEDRATRSDEAVRDLGFAHSGFVEARADECR